MKIEEDVKLDYSDVLIRPKRSTLSSRSEVSLERSITFPISKQNWRGVPIIAANMDTIGTYDVYTVLSTYKIITAFHKFYDVNDYLCMHQKGLDPNFFMVSTGITEKDYEKLISICSAVDVKFICIDVANGYMEQLVGYAQCEIDCIYCIIFLFNCLLDELFENVVEIMQ